MKKRVLIAINNFTSNTIGISLVSFLNALDYSKYEVSLIFRNAQSNLLNQIPKCINIMFSPFDEKKIGLIDKIKYFRKFNFGLMYDIGSEKLSDFVRFSSKNNGIFLHKNYKNIYVVGSKLNDFVIENKINSYKYILFPNKTIKDDFINIFSDLSDKSIVLDYLVNEKRVLDLSRANVEVSKPNYKTLLFAAGTLNDRSKNYTLMIKLMHNLVKINNHVHLWILGDGPDLVNIKMLVNKLGLNDYVTLFGFKNNPYPYMAMADYVLNTSDSTDSSMTLIEARILQKPIISTSVDFKNNNTYIVSSDPDKIAGEVNDVLIKRIKYLGQNNFWAENQHIMKIFEQIVNKK